jgi:hypothetical protein
MIEGGRPERGDRCSSVPERLGGAFSVFVSVTLNRQAEENLDAFET